MAYSDQKLVANIWNNKIKDSCERRSTYFISFCYCKELVNQLVSWKILDIENKNCLLRIMYHLYSGAKQISPYHRTVMYPLHNGAKQISPYHRTVMYPLHNGAKQISPYHGTVMYPLHSGAKQISPYHRTVMNYPNWGFSTLTEVYPCFFLSCKVNARV
jgi:hypothetical protein